MPRWRLTALQAVLDAEGAGASRKGVPGLWPACAASSGQLVAGW